MSGQPGPAGVAIANARALLACVLAGGWRELHVVSDNFEIFIAALGAGPNPMRAQLPAAPAPETGTRISVNAPHVATLVAVPQQGALVAKGETVATLSVLDEEIAVPSPAAGIIGPAEAAIGGLVEFDQTILSLRGVA